MFPDMNTSFSLHRYFGMGGSITTEVFSRLFYRSIGTTS